MATSYSESELADIARVKKSCLITDEDLESINKFFEDGKAEFVLFSLDVASGGRCSDGKRRSNLDYLDFLFPSPNIEELIAESNNKADRIFTTTIELTNPQVIGIRFTLNKS
jgi:hypothetical protein